MAVACVELARGQGEVFDGVSLFGREGADESFEDVDAGWEDFFAA